MKNVTKAIKTTGIRIFVYGTLKEGHPNSCYLAESEFLGRAKLHGHYAMVDLTAYPGCVRTRGISDRARQHIYGEVYRVDENTLASIDILEGNGQYFTRSKVTTPYKNAWMYFLPTSYLTPRIEITDGVWRPNDAEKRYIESG